jgi:ABC-type Na+ efflux pump permease subunit
VVLAAATVGGAGTAAQPEPPHRYFGHVEADDGSAVDGVNVDAVYDGEVVASDITDGDGYYDLRVRSDDVGGDAESVTLTVGENSEPVAWESGGSTQVDFTVTSEPPTASPTPTPTDDGGDPGGGGSTVTETETETTTETETETDTETETATDTETETETETGTATQTTKTETETETATDTETGTLTESPRETDLPGFGFGVALVAILVFTVASRRR